MPFLTIFQEVLVATWRPFVILAALSGISNAAVLAIINSVASSITDRDAIGHALVLLVLAIAIYSFSQRALMVMSATLAETTVANMRVRFIERLQRADLLDVEKLNRSELYTCISSEMQVLSDGSLALTIAGQALVVILVTTFYLAWLSMAALFLAFIFIALAASLHLAHAKEIDEKLGQASQLETRMLEGFVDFVDGFKEVKLNSARSRELSTCIRELSLAVATRRLNTRELFATNFVASQISFFLLTGMMVFIVPLVGKTDSATVTKITATVLFLIGPISVVVSGLPVLQRVNAAAKAILSLERRLDVIGQTLPERQTILQSIDFSHFRRITTEDVTFRYDADDGGFVTGPINLEINRGQVIFITGGNGSGKSTLLKLITGLYQPSSGSIKIDGQPITPANVNTYENLFVAIFSDYHLFQELYGTPPISSTEVDELLALMEMAHKVRIEGRAFNTVALSGGQRKRLAMVAALLEHRPICVFDEWAADQDPLFRLKFYRELLPMLRVWDKTIIAVTHDDRYFDAADLRVHLEEGRLVSSADYRGETTAGRES
jgi:putative ATP-binding cassette transporter